MTSVYFALAFFCLIVTIRAVRLKTPKKTSKFASIFLFVSLTFLFAVLGLIQVGEAGRGAKAASVDSDNSSSSSSPAKIVKVGQTLNTDYFAITVNKCEVDDEVSTGNQFADLKKDPGNKYIVFNVTFKNTDNESRMIMDGELLVNYQDKDYKFDKSETILTPGWGLVLDQINPLVTKTTNLVYKIPDELKGNLYWHPGRADDNQQIYLGTL